jgi:hypothetical protein
MTHSFAPFEQFEAADLTRLLRLFAQDMGIPAEVLASLGANMIVAAALTEPAPDREPDPDPGEEHKPPIAEPDADTRVVTLHPTPRRRRRRPPTEDIAA